MARLLAGLLLLALALGGCGGSSHPDGPCDPREGWCQERLARLVAEVRGGPFFAPPPVEIIDEDELRARIEADYAALTPAQALDLERWGRALVLLGLASSPDALTAGTIDAFVMGVAAFYSRATGMITVIDRGTPDSLADASFVFAHELTHYAQDLDPSHGFVSLPGSAGKLDTVDAHKHLIEGEAVVVSNLVVARLQARTLPQSAWDTYFGSWLEEVRTYVADDPDPYVSTRNYLPYVVGGAYLQAARAEGGAIGMLAEWDAPIADTASYVQGYPARTGAAAVTDCDLPATPAGHVVLGDDRLGAEQLFAMLAGAEVAGGGAADAPASWSAAGGWRGEALRIYVEDGGDPALAKVAVALRLRLADGVAATALAGALDAAVGAWADVIVEGSDVLRLAGEEATLFDAWDYPLTCDGVPLSAAGVKRRVPGEERHPVFRSLRASRSTW